MAAEATSWPLTGSQSEEGLEPPRESVLTIYRLALADFVHLEPVLLTLVSAAEQVRAERYQRPADRARFLIGRAGLRVLLSRWLNCSPQAVPLVANAFGKPQLAPPADVHFNVTHSGAWVVMAVGAQPVGIDVEKFEPDFDYMAVMAHSFGAAERDVVIQSPNPQAAFYALWTQHEARAKAAGHGLLGSLTPEQAAEWAVLDIEVAPGYAAALAYPAHWHPTLVFCTCNGERICPLSLP